MPKKPDVVAHPPCPECNGEGYVDTRLPAKDGFKKKPCPRCGGRGWVKKK